MIIPDSNLLVYAYNSESRFHKQSKKWLEDAVHRQISILLPWVTCLSFLRLMTHRSVLEHPMRPEECFSCVEEWHSLDCVQQVDLGSKGRKIFKEFVDSIQPVGNLFYDAYLAALAREYSATVYTNDGDFLRFSGIKVANPLSD